MNALAGLMNPMAVGQSFQMGLEQGRARRGEMETQNALSLLAKDPNSAEGMEKLAFYQPQAAMQMQEKRAAAMAKQAEGQLLQRAIGGDAAAMDELATVSFDKWKTLDANAKTQATEESKIFGNAALDLLNTPPEQRGAKLQGYVQQMGQQYPEVAQIAQLPPAQLEAALRSAVFEAQMVDKLITMERPDYQVLPEGATLVDTRNPAAVAQFGGQPQQAPRQQAAPQILPRTARPQGLSDDQLFAQARQAVEQGADVDTVFRQLREWGVEVN